MRLRDVRGGSAEVFAIVGRVSTVVGAPEKSRESRAFDAANGCPVNAISAKR